MGKRIECKTDKPIGYSHKICPFCTKCVGITHNIFYICEAQCEQSECKDYCTVSDAKDCKYYKQKRVEQFELQRRMLKSGHEKLNKRIGMVRTG